MSHNIIIAVYCVILLIAMYKGHYIIHTSVTGGMVVECAEVKKQFRDFVVMRLRQKYSKVVRKLIHIFKENKVDIEELITILCFDDVDKNSVFSTDAAFSTIRTEI